MKLALIRSEEVLPKIIGLSMLLTSLRRLNVTFTQEEVTVINLAYLEAVRGNSPDLSSLEGLEAEEALKTSMSPHGFWRRFRKYERFGGR